MRLVRHEIARGDVAAVARRGQDRDLGDDLSGHVAQAHAAPGLQPHRLQPGKEVAVGVQFGGGLIAGLAQVRRAQDHHRHRHVDQRDVDAVDLFQQMARRQQPAGLGPDDVHEVQPHRGGRAGHPGDDLIAVVIDRTVIGADHGLDPAGGVLVIDDDARLAAGSRDHAAFDGKGADAGKDVAAGRPGIHHRFGHRDLGEQIVDIHPLARGGTHHRHLGGQRVRAPDAVDLARIGRAHRRQQHAVARGGVGRQVVGAEIRPLRGAAAHDDDGNAVLFGHVVPPFVQQEWPAPFGAGQAFVRRPAARAAGRRSGSEAAPRAGSGSAPMSGSAG